MRHILILLLACTSNAATPSTEVWISRRVARVHDDAKNVTCWVVTSGGIHCIPDSQVKR